MMIYLKDGTHFYISDKEYQRIGSFSYDYCGERDYEATVRRDWESLDENESNAIQTSEFADKLRKLGVQIPVDIEKIFLWLLDQRQQGVSISSLKEFIKQLKPETAKALELAFGIEDSSKYKMTIKSILDGFSVVSINQICDVFDSSNLDILWAENTYMNNKYTIAHSTRKELNATRKHLTGHIKKCRSSGYYPPIISDTMQEALKLATAYRDFLSLELIKSRYKPNGTEYKDMTRRDEWNDILIKVYEILAGEIKQKNGGRLEHGDEKIIHTLTARLLAATHHWCWGESKIAPEKAAKIIKDRLYRLKYK